jgi:hypothetical protein
MPNIDGTGNSLLTDDVILSESLRLLENELVALRVVNRSAESKFGGAHKVGDSISVKKPYRAKAVDGRFLQVQPMVDQSVAMTVDRQSHFALQFTQNDRTLHINDFSDRYLKSGIAQLAHKVDYSILLEAKNTTFNQVGTSGNTFNDTVAIDARAKATKLGVPNDAMVRLLLDPLDAAGYRKGLRGLSNESMVKAAIERSYLGPIANMDTFETAQMPSHTVGVATGTPRAHAGGGSLTGSSISTDGWTADTTGILKKGDIITFAGVYSINPQTYESTGMAAQFVVTADANSGASTGPAVLSLSPAINDGTLTTVDGEGNTVSLSAYQNVTAAPADDALISVVGTGGTTRRENLMLHKDAISVAIVDIEAPEAAMVSKRARHDKSGISMLMTAGYNINDFTQIYRIDILWGVKNWYPELGMRVHGAA